MARFYMPTIMATDIDELVKNMTRFEREWEGSGRHRLWCIVDVASFNVFDSDMHVRTWIRQRGRMVASLPAFSRAKDRTIHIYLVE